MMVNIYRLTSSGRLNSRGTLASEPECSLFSTGSKRHSITNARVAHTAMPINVIRQPSSCPTTRPNGKPSTIASAVPPASMLSACAFLPAGATRMANDAVIDQNTECASATPAREITKVVKFQATAVSTWLAINRINTPISSFRRSILLVSNIQTSDIVATIQA
ncbi:hypothetical protein D3C80_1597580 [compost metagenome]